MESRTGHRFARVLGALGAAALALGCPRTARAQPATAFPVELTWRAPAECPSREWVLAEIGRLLSASQDPRIPTTATVAVDRDESARWRGKLSLDAREAHSERTLEAETCDAVAAAAALVLAIAVEGGMPPPVQSATLSAPAPAPAPAPPTPNPTPNPTATAPPTTSSAARRASQLVLSLAGFLDGGTMPTVAPGGEAAIGWIYTGSGFRIRVLGAFSLYQEQSTLEQVPLVSLGAFSNVQEGADFQLHAASLVGCASLVQGVLDVGPCLGAQLGFMSASGSGPTGSSFVSESHETRWVALEGGLLGSWSVTPRVALFGRADGLFSPKPASFFIDNSQTLPRVSDTKVHTVSTFSGRAVLGLEVRFF